MIIRVRPKGLEPTSAKHMWRISSSVVKSLTCKLHQENSTVHRQPRASKSGPNWWWGCSVEGKGRGHCLHTWPFLISGHSVGLGSMCKVGRTQCRRTPQKAHSTSTCEAGEGPFNTEWSSCHTLRILCRWHAHATICHFIMERKHYQNTM